MTTETESIAVALIIQGTHRFFVGSMPSSVLADACFVTYREEDQDAGFQRTLNYARAKDIADYIDSGFGTIPTSIILSAQEVAELTYDSRAKTIRFRLTPKSFKVIDGQHRVWGFKLAKTSIRVPVAIYNDLDLSQEARLFIDINTKQKPVPKELVLDIQRLARTGEDTQQLLNEVFDIFHEAADSPLYGRTSPYKKKTNTISRVTFTAAVKPLLYLFDEKTAARLYQVLSAYLAAVKDVLARMDEPVDLGQPVVFRAYLQALPELLERAVPIFGSTISPDQWLKLLTGAESLRATTFTKNLKLATQQILGACKPKIKL